MAWLKRCAVSALVVLLPACTSAERGPAPWSSRLRAAFRQGDCAGADSIRFELTQAPDSDLALSVRIGNACRDAARARRALADSSWDVALSHADRAIAEIVPWTVDAPPEWLDSIRLAASAGVLAETGPLSTGHLGMAANAICRGEPPRVALPPPTGERDHAVWPSDERLQAAVPTRLRPAALEALTHVLCDSITGGTVWYSCGRYTQGLMTVNLTVRRVERRLRVLSTAGALVAESTFATQRVTCPSVATSIPLVGEINSAALAAWLGRTLAGNDAR